MRIAPEGDFYARASDQHLSTGARMREVDNSLHRFSNRQNLKGSFRYMILVNIRICKGGIQ
jgi:hypothetical protein